MSLTDSLTRVDENNGRSSPALGHVYWSSTKSIWITLMFAGAILGGYATFSPNPLLLCMGLCLVTLGPGYSVGIHRRLIHNSFQCPQWLENILVYLGVLTSTVGPFSAIEQHDLREWAQRSPDSHPYFKGHANPLIDWFWALHCDIHLDYPPIVRYEPRIAHNRLYQWLEQTRILQQLPLAIAFYHLGGWSWVFWGIYVRISLCTMIQWSVRYLSARVERSSKPSQSPHVFFRNVPALSLFSFGESWQSNHQAFPESARFSLDPGQYDPSWWFIKFLRSVGLAWNVKQTKRRVAMPLTSVLTGGAQISRSHTSQKLSGAAQSVPVESVVNRHR